MAKIQIVEDTCPMGRALNILSGKWKLYILWKISKRNRRFNELKKELGDISARTLTMQLRELEEDRMIERIVIADSPPKVEYQITEVGSTLAPIFEMLCDWGKNYNQRYQE